MNMQAQREMPRYECHKEVCWALKIAKIERHIACDPNNEYDPSVDFVFANPTGSYAVLTPANEGYAPFRVDHEYMRKHKPAVGGYFVVYKNGCTSFSPAEVFENGYILD